jgi:DNA mismatch endonuclease (patch repair protein)
MASNRRRDTIPELRLRSALHRRGFRFRVDMPIPVQDRRPIRPDIVFTRSRLAVFIDGCFWHGCPEHGSSPKANTDYWVPKLARTRRRDEEADRLLRLVGWSVLRIWEHVAIADAEERVLRMLPPRMAGEGHAVTVLDGPSRTTRRG